MIYFKKLAHMIVIELAILKSMELVSKLEFRQGFYLTVLRQNSFFRKPQSLFLGLSTDSMRATYIIVVNLLYLKSTDYQCSSRQTVISKQVFDQTSRHNSLAK